MRNLITISGVYHDGGEQYGQQLSIFEPSYHLEEAGMGDCNVDLEGIIESVLIDYCEDDIERNLKTPSNYGPYMLGCSRSNERVSFRVIVDMIDSVEFEFKALSIQVWPSGKSPADWEWRGQSVLKDLLNYFGDDTPWSMYYEEK